MEGTVTDWSAQAANGLTTGGWQRAVPVGATNGTLASAPASDASSSGTQAWITQNGTSGATATTADVDVGTARLLSPVFDLSGAASATVSYARWYYCSDAPPAGSTPAEVDPLTDEVSADGGATWATLETVSTVPSPNAWVRVSFAIESVLPALTSQVRVRFSISDTPDNSITEAGVDDFSMTVTTCVNPCTGDFDGDGVVNGGDLGVLLASWGSSSGDLNGDGIVNGADLGALLAVWGPCP